MNAKTAERSEEIYCDNGQKGKETVGKVGFEEQTESINNSTAMRT